MPLVTTGHLINEAHATTTAVAAFNVITLEHAEAIVAGAQNAGHGVILQISENAIRYHHNQVEPLVAACLAVARYATVPVSVHLDHIEDVALLRAGVGAGVSSVMFDAARLDYEANVATTREAAAWAHDHGVWLEAELGEVGGKDGAHAPGVRTDPTEAASFVEQTGVDALAVAVGSSHAMTSRTAALDFALISALRDAVPVPLVLHGSSGVADEDLQRAVTAGITKVNVGTILNISFTGAVRERLDDPAIVDPRKYFGPAREAIASTVEHIVRTLRTPVNRLSFTS